MEKIGIRTQELFKRVNEERERTKQRVFENRAMAIMFSMSFTALTKEWIDFKKEFVDIGNEQVEALETICREKFNVDLQGTIDEFAMIAGRPALYQKLRESYSRR